MLSIINSIYIQSNELKKSIQEPPNLLFRRLLHALDIIIIFLVSRVELLQTADYYNGHCICSDTNDCLELKSDSTLIGSNYLLLRLPV